MAEYDTADPNDPNTLVVPFIFVPHGCPLPVEWMAEHPGWVRFPATMVPRDPTPGDNGPQWNMQVDFPDEPTPPDTPTGAADADVVPAQDWPQPPENASTGAPAALNIEDYDTTASALRAWRNAEAAFADPVGAAGIRRVADAQPAQSRHADITFVDFANRPLGSPAAGIQASVGNDPPNKTTSVQAAPAASVHTGIELAAAGDLKCGGFSSGCQSGGSQGTTGMYSVGGRTLCAACTEKMLGITDLPAKERPAIMEPFLSVPRE
jgi:hypothetical protein